MTLRTLADAAAAVRAAHERVESLRRDLKGVRAQKLAIEEELETAEAALAKAQATLNKMAVHGEAATPLR